MTLNRAARKGSRSRQSYVDWALIATIIFAGIPAAITLDMRVRSIPVINAFLLTTALCVTVGYLVRFTGDRKLVYLYVVTGLGICGVSILRWDGPLYDARTAFQDIFCYAALPIGIALAQLKGRIAFHDLLARCYYAATVLFAISLAMLLTGYVQSAGGESRQLDGAMYTSTFIIAMSFPCLWSKARSKARAQKFLACSGMALSVFFAVISATRSVFITILISLVCTAVVEIKRSAANLLWIGSAILILAGAVTSGYTPGLATFERSTLGTRLAATDYANEDRFDELTMMLDQMSISEWLHGAGFGSGFESPIPDSGVATVPHIGITTLLYKGGAPALAVLIVGPCIFSVLGLLLFRFPERDPFLAGVAVYFVQSCLSGGWSFLPLLFLGAFLQMGLTKEKRTQHGPRVFWSEMPAGSQAPLSVSRSIV